jgi:hypothetical protein
VLLKFGCNIDNICDNYGRNPLHDACCCISISSCLATVKIILEHCKMNQDSNKKKKKSSGEQPATTTTTKTNIHQSALRLFFKPDNSGALPLSYVRREHWGHWLQFLAFKKDEYLPESGGTNSANVSVASIPVPIYYVKNNYTPQIIPPLPIEVARMVASGKLPPEQARKFTRALLNRKKRENNYTNENEIDVNKEDAVNHNHHQYDYSNNDTDNGEIDDAISSGATTNKTIPVREDQESKFRDIIFYVENTVIRNREKRIATALPGSTNQRRSITTNHDADSTVYPDSVSGVEFYCDSFDEHEGMSSESESDDVRYDDVQEFEQFQQEQEERYYQKQRRRKPADDVDSTAYPDSVYSGVEFYTESVVHSVVGADADSTAFPDSVSGVEFYSESYPVNNSNYYDSSKSMDEGFADVDSTAFPDSVSGVEFYCESGAGRGRSSRSTVGDKENRLTNKGRKSSAHQERRNEVERKGRSDVNESNYYTHVRRHDHKVIASPTKSQQQEQYPIIVTTTKSPPSPTKQQQRRHSKNNVAAIKSPITSPRYYQHRTSPTSKIYDQEQQGVNDDDPYVSFSVNPQRDQQGQVNAVHLIEYTEGDDTTSTSCNSDSERCIGGSSFHSFLEI